MGKISLEELLTDNQSKPIEAVLEFLADNPRPTDEQIHAWATENGHTPEEVEEYIYKILGGMMQRMAKAFKTPDDEFDKNELARGIEIEKEHTDSELIAKIITKTHLGECRTYNLRLDKMEKECKADEGEVSTEGAIDGKRHREIEYTFYAKLADMSQLQNAIHKEEHEQWAVPVETEAEAKVRIRAINDMRWILTTKFKYEGRVGVEEVECDISKDMFNDLRMLSTGGMKKTRYVFKIDGSDKVWEIDVFKDAEGKDHPWVKIDLEVDGPGQKLPQLPVDVIKDHLIARQGESQTPEEKAQISKLWGQEWVSLDSDQRLK